ncbi:MAG: hypothetical protein CVV02_00070 [Firmicutes bacterium HGW-Firmicutes-7]|nr:MAG: hypothetical protein CVV02_00070 [Firmicutes bacterium HGW-Firmicutes-7]
MNNHCCNCCGGIINSTSSNLTNTSGFAASTAGQIIAVVLGGTSISLPDSQNLSSDITPNVANTVFTISPSGRYYISYHVNLSAALAVGTRLLINGSPNTASTLTATLTRSSFSNNVIVTLPANSTITLELFGLIGLATLLNGGAGASLTIIRVAA